MTPKFVTIITAGTGAGAGGAYSAYGSAYVFGLTAEGEVYKWCADYGTSQQSGWLKLEGVITK